MNWVISLISPILGGVIAGSVGFWIACWKWKRDGHDRFLAVIYEWEAELDGCENISDQAEKVHAASLIPLRSAVFAVQPFVSQDSFKRLLDRWHCYKNEKTDALTAAERLAKHDIEGRGPDKRPLYPVDTLRMHLRKFQEEVSPR